MEYTPADQKSLYRRASALEKIGKFNEAISDAQRLISLSSKEGSADEQTNALLRKLRENAENKVKNNNSSFSLIFSLVLAYATYAINFANSTDVRSNKDAIKCGNSM